MDAQPEPQPLAPTAPDQVGITLLTHGGDLEICLHQELRASGAVVERVRLGELGLVGEQTIAIVAPDPDLVATAPADTWQRLGALLSKTQPRRLVIVSSILADDAFGDPDAAAPFRAFEAELAATTDHPVILRAGHLHGRRHLGFVGQLLAVLREAGRPWLRRHHAERLFYPLHLLDLAQAVARAVDGPPGAWVVTGSAHPTVGEILAILDDEARRHRYPLRRLRLPRARRPDVDVLAASAAEAHGALGYTPAVELRNGLADTLYHLLAEAEATADADDFEGACTATEEADVLAAEARFWDEQQREHEKLYARPHDWRFDTRLGETLQKPVYRFVKRAIRKHRPRRILDLGCGGGFHAVALARLGCEVHGIDVSPGKIAQARKLAALHDVSDRVRFSVGNVLEHAEPEPVDMVTAFGVLHHLPDLERHLPPLLARNLKPEGRLLTVEPHFEDGFHPRIQRFMGRLAKSRWSRHFDSERFYATLAVGERGRSLRSESPAGVTFHRDDFDIDAFFRATFDVEKVQYLNALAPFMANAFVIYMRRPWIRGTARALMPAIVRLDGLLTKRKSWRTHAAEAAWLLRSKRCTT